MIHPTAKDVGRYVVYQNRGSRAEAGVITSMNADLVHVRFVAGQKPVGCYRENLTWLDDMIERPAPLIETELAAIAERHAAATPGEWIVADGRWVDVKNTADNPSSFAVVNARGRTDENWESDVAFCAAAHQDIPRLLQREAELLMALHDRMQESAMLEQGRREVLGAALGAMDAVIRDREDTAAMHDKEWDGEEAFHRREQANAVTRARNLLMETYATLFAADPLPPDQVRAENARLRAVLRQGVEASHIYNNSPLKEFVRSAREVLGEKEPT